MAKSIILYFTQFRSIHTQRTLADYSVDRGRHTKRKIFLEFVVGRISYLNVKRSEMSEK